MSGDSKQLEVIELRCCFGDTIALDGRSFTVPRGPVFGFLGPTGASKTPAMRAIVGVGRAILRTGSRLRVWHVLRSAA